MNDSESSGERSDANQQTDEQRSQVQRDFLRNAPSIRNILRSSTLHSQMPKTSFRNFSYWSRKRLINSLRGPTFWVGSTPSQNFKSSVLIGKMPGEANSCRAKSQRHYLEMRQKSRANFSRQKSRVFEIAFNSLPLLHEPS